jgi:hypothetical protein
MPSPAAPLARPHVHFSPHVLKRFLLRSLVLAGILLACFAHLIWNGWHAKKVIGENLPHPSLSTDKRDIDLWAPTYEPGRLYDLTFERGEETGGTLPPDARLKVQLASNGRTRLLVVRKGHPNTDVSWWALLTGREKLQIVADREWIDLGPAPQPGETLEVQVSGLLPGPYGFAQIFTHDRPHFSLILAVRPESPGASITRTTLRYKFQRVEPVPAREMLARFFFFISCSRVLQVTAVVAVLLLFAGWSWLFEKRHARAVACLVPAVTLIHACCLAPFQGADEATHAGTVEAVIWNPGAFARWWKAYPKSLALLYDSIGYERWVRYADVPVSIDTTERRDRMREVARRCLDAEAAQEVINLPDAYLINPRIRSPLYYNGFRLLGPVLRRMSVLDRLEAYVALSACASLLLFGLGLFVLVRTRLSETILLLYGLVALVPYSVGVVASCSNYSLAIGIGQLLAACLVAGVLSERPRTGLGMAGLFSLASLAGIGVWDDFVFFAVPSTVVLTVLSAHAAYRMPAGSRRRLATGAMLVLGILLAGTLAFALATGRIRYAISSFGARLPQSLGGFEDPSLWLLLGAAAAPFVAALALALAIVRSRGMSEAGRERAARARSAALVVLFVVMFLATPWTSVPFESLRLDYPDEVAAHWSAFWSNNFAFDQDVLFWKMYWGVFGYADVSYPDALYALVRWACVGLFLALPIMSWRFTHRSPGRSAFLLVASGYALTACVVTNSLRYFLPVNPWGRYILPLLALAALPALARTSIPGRERWWRAVTFIAIALHLWTALTLLGSRYAVGI